MHTTFGCACLLTDKFVVVADVFFRKDDGEGCSAALSQSVRKPPCLDNRQRHSFDDQRLTVFIGDTCHLAHNGPETLSNRGVIFRRETRKISVTGLDQAHFEQIQGHYARTRKSCQMSGKRCFTRMRGALKEKNHLKKRRKKRLNGVIDPALSDLSINFCPSRSAIFPRHVLSFASLLFSSSRMSGTAIHDALRGVKAALPFWLGFFPLGFILGAQACHKGMSVPTAAAMSFFNYAGGSEFAAVALWTATPPLLLIAFTTWLINSRHIVMGMALSLYTRKLSTGKSLFAFFLMCDEVWAVSMQEISRRKAAGVPEDEWFCYAFHVGTGLGFWLPWTCSTALGAFMGGTLGDLNQWGFSMAFPATFITLIVLMWPGFKNALPLTASGIVSAVCSFWIASHWCVLLGTLTGLVLAAFLPLHSENQAG